MMTVLIDLCTVCHAAAYYVQRLNYNILQLCSPLIARTLFLSCYVLFDCLWCGSLSALATCEKVMVIVLGMFFLLLHVS